MVLFDQAPDLSGRHKKATPNQGWPQINKIKKEKKLQHNKDNKTNS